jgi:DNA repair protein RadC
VLRASEKFRPAITRNCPNILICHNHPTGAVEPSQEDIAVAQQLIEAAKVLDLELVDHLIIGAHRFISLKERLRW